MVVLGRARRLIQFGLLLLAAALLALPVTVAAQTADNCGALGRIPTEDESTETDFWKTVYILDEVRPNSIISDGNNLFLLDQALPKLFRIPLGEKTVRTCSLPTPWDVAADEDPLPDRKLSVLLLGPRAFYLIATDILSDVPTIFRADRFPSAIRGGWRELRQLGGEASVGLAAVAQDDTLFVLRSGPKFEVEWQPIRTASQEALPPSGRVVTLSPTFRPRPAAGVTVTRDMIYAFGGRGTPNDVTRIPLQRAAPGTPKDLPTLPNPRVDAQALIHGSYIYLVGGNDPGKPTIERHRLPLPEDASRVLWEAVPEPPPDGGAVVAAAFARGELWIVREDGRIQRMNVAEVAPGRAQITWDRTIKRSRLVQKGTTVEVPIDWEYRSPVELKQVTAELTSSPKYIPIVLEDTTCASVRRTVASSKAARLTVATTTLPAEPTGTSGPRMLLTVEIPADGQRCFRPRTEYVVTITPRSGNPSAKLCLQTDGIPPCQQKIGPPLVLRFVVDKTIRPPTPTPTP